MGTRGKKIVLTAGNSESSEYEQKAWSQMLLATFPARYTKAFNINLPRPNELAPDGQARYVPHGLRIIESILLQKFSPDDVVVCYQEQLSLTGLQWEFFFTYWLYNLDFWRRERSTQWKFNAGIPLYYYLMGRRTFGSSLNYPLFRLAHFPEWFLRRKLHLDFSGRMQPRWKAPDAMPVPGTHHRPMPPDLSEISPPSDPRPIL